MKAQSLGSHQLSCGSFLVFLYEKNWIKDITKIRRKHLLPPYFLVSRLWNQSIPKLFVLLLLLGFLVIIIAINQELSDFLEDRIGRDCHNHAQHAMDIAG